ncbi:alpha-2-macroglobulin-like protein 1 [Pelodytes ibericus]
MKLLLVVVCLTIWCSTSDGTSEPKPEPDYLITVPGWMTYPSTEKACVVFNHLKGKLHLKLEIIVHEPYHVYLLAEDNIDGPDHDHCYTFQVPKFGEAIGTPHFRVLAEAENLNINQTRSISVHKMGSITMIQTDKNIYKPGQTVNIRIVNLEKNLHALDTKIPVVKIKCSGECETEFSGDCEIEFSGDCELEFSEDCEVEFSGDCELEFSGDCELQFSGYCELEFSGECEQKLQDNWNQNTKYKDVKRNIIAQWQDVSPVKGIIDLSFHLADEVPLGEYKIVMPNQHYQTFTVAEYELKRFEVLINAPEMVESKDDLFKVEVCGRYTHGKPVQGLLNIYVCDGNFNPLINVDHGTNPACQQFLNILTDRKGCFTKEIDLHFFNLTVNYVNTLTISSSLKEHVLGVEEKAEKKLHVGTIQMVFFKDTEYFYRKGINYTGTVSVVGRDKQPKAKETVYLTVDNYYDNTNISVVTDENGLARFTLDTSKWTDRVSVTGTFHLESFAKSEYKWLSPFYSGSNSFIKLDKTKRKWNCDTKESVAVEYFIETNDLHNGSDHLDIFYMVVSKGSILHFAKHKLDIAGHPDGENLKGSFNAQLDIRPDMFPEAVIIVFTILRGGAIPADRGRYIIPSCFKNKVKLQYSEKEVQPRGKVNLDITAESGSMCSVRSVDKGLLLIKPNEKFSDNIPDEESYDRREMFFLHRLYWRQTTEDEPERTQCSKLYRPFSVEADVGHLFQFSLLKIFTNSKIYKPADCPDLDFAVRSSGGQTQDKKDKHPASHSPTRPKARKPVTRKDFPETWLFDLVSLGEDGHEQLHLTAPDSITGWVTDAFCLSQSGYAEVQNVEITTFKPYYVDMILPESVVQGEMFPLTVLVFNYLSTPMVVTLVPLFILNHCLILSVSLIKVEATLSECTDFTAVDTNKERVHCIGVDQSTIFTWNVTATKIGKIKLKVSSGALKIEGECSSSHIDQTQIHVEDAIEKTIKVKPTGVKEEKTHNYVLCPKDGSLRQDVELHVPDNVVAGSEHADIYVMGDMLNNAILNVENICDLPDGCGEQNMANFISSVHLFVYLKDTKQLTPEIERYQKHIKFQNEDGSYSYFPDDDANVWVTSFVIKSLSHARGNIFVDESKIQRAVEWLSTVQDTEGCFHRHENYYNKYSEDNDDEEEVKKAQKLQVTAYAAIALLEDKDTLKGKTAEKALSCLKKEALKVNCTFTKALTVYALTLSGDTALRQQLLDDMEKHAIDEGKTKHWEVKAELSRSIEVNAYMLLTLLSGEDASKHLEEATQVMNWIISRQNSYGSFFSSQDTAVGLQALVKYAKRTFSGTGDVSVTVRSISGFQKQFLVDKNHALRLQKASLPDIPGEYTVTAIGNGCAYMQAHLVYHIPVVKADTYFSLSVSTRPAVCTYQTTTSFEVFVEISYTGKRVSSNMAIIEVELLSGFVSNKNSVIELIKHPHVKRTENNEDKLVIYLDEVKHEKMSISFNVIEEIHVENRQPATVLAYDYYEPSEEVMRLGAQSVSVSINMKLLLVVVCLTIWCSTSDGTSEPKPEPDYLITVPGWMTYPSTEKACVVFNHLKGKLHLKLEIIVHEPYHVYLLAEDNIDGPDHDHCYTFQVPKFAEAIGTTHFRVLAESENLNINQTRSISVNRMGSITMIQTDKNIYKPGQTVNIRIVNLEKNLHVLDTKIPVVKIKQHFGGLN